MSQSNQNHLNLQIDSTKQDPQPNMKITNEKPSSLAEDNPKYKSDIDKANIISSLHFFYTFPLLIKGWRKNKKNEAISEEDLVTLPYERRAEVLESKYLEHLQKQKQKNSNKPAKTALAIFANVKWIFFKGVAIETYLGFMRVFSAYIMKRLIDCFMEPETISDAYKWAGILGAIILVALYGEHHWISLASHLGAQIRASVISMLYTKISKLSLYSIVQISSGKLMNVAANDVNLFEALGVFMPGFISGWFILFAGTALLWTYFGVNCLLGVGFLVAIIPIQILISHISVKPLEEINILTDERVRKISEAIQGIRLLKMYTWELKFRDIIADLRKRDIKLIRKVLYWINVLSRGLCWGAQYMAAFLMFMLYHFNGGELTMGKAFSAYFVLGFIRIYFVYFVSNGFSFIAEARLFFERFDKIMNAPEMEEITFESPLDANNSIEFDQFTAHWTDKDQTNSGSSNSIESKPTLIDLNLKLAKGSLNAVVGAVGAGKTSLLLSFTGEMPKTTGKLRYEGKIAYVEQEPTIFEGTFRENVLFGKDYDEAFYNKVIKACNLENDLKLFPQGDMSMIGEGGNNLSGGQKARLALARAVYANADIYLLDDPLSAVDAKVAKSIYQDCIKGLLKEKTVILVTHRVYFVRDVENIIVMERGKITGNGNFNQLKEQGIDVNTIFSIDEKEEEDLEENLYEETEAKETDVLLKKEEVEQKHDDEGVEFIPRNQEDVHESKVTLKTYKKLFGEVGWGVIFAILLLFLLTQFGDIAFGRILGGWIMGDFEPATALSTLGGIGIFMILVYQLKYLAFTFGFNDASKSYHKKMLTKLIHSPVSFFDANPIGQILTRFSNDIGILDKYVPLVGLDVLDMNFVVASNFIIISVFDPILIIPLAATILIIAVIAVLTYPTIKQTKAYHLETGEPVFSLFSSSIHGISIIRIFGQSANLKKKFTNLLHINNKANMSFLLSSSIMGLFIDFTYNIIAVGMFFITTARLSSNGNPGLAAFSIALIMSVTDVFQWGIRQFCQTNILMSAAARVQSYCNLPSEAPLFLQEDQDYAKKGWPQKGQVDFNKVYMKYDVKADYVIKDLNLHVASGEKIGCVGRTGAGKSSTINLLFRLQEIEKSQESPDQSSIKIDEVDTREFGLHLLRNNISIIPQVPFIFTGTVRQNIDPLGQFMDDQIWDALQEVRLKDHVDRLKDKLETQITNASEVFSVGQKQLICLARTLLKPRKILVLDEATANMDTETDSFIQQKIRERFNTSTVFTIAHRLSTIANYDKVLVLDKGRKIEFDAPYKLLVNKIGDTSVTNTTGFFASMVMNTGPKSAQQILNIAKETFFKNMK